MTAGDFRAREVSLVLAWILGGRMAGEQKKRQLYACKRQLYAHILLATGLECVGEGTLNHPVDSSGRSRTLVLDPAGRLLSVLHGGHNLTPPGLGNIRDVHHVYDYLDRVLEETSVNVTHTNEWDKAGNRIRITYGVTDRVIESDYDALHRLDEMREKLPAEGTWTTTEHAYDGNGNLLTKTHQGNGTVEHTTYDALNRRTTHYVVRTSDSAQLTHFTFSYDRASNVRHIAE